MNDRKLKRILTSLSLLEGVDVKSINASNYELSKEGRVGVAAYDLALSEILSSHFWRFLRRKAILENPETTEIKDFEFDCAFRLPKDFDIAYGVYADFEDVFTLNDNSDFYENPIRFETFRISHQIYDDLIYANARKILVAYQVKDIDSLTVIPSYFETCLDFGIRKNACPTLVQSSSLTAFYERKFLQVLDAAKMKDLRFQRKNQKSRRPDTDLGPFTRRY